MILLVSKAQGENEGGPNHTILYTLSKCESSCKNKHLETEKNC